MLPLPAARPLTIHSRPIGSGLEIRTGEPQGHLGSWGFPIRIRGPIPCQGPPGDSPGVSLGIRIENKKNVHPVALPDGHSLIHTMVVTALILSRLTRHSFTPPPPSPQRPFPCSDISSLFPTLLFPGLPFPPRPHIRTYVFPPHPIPHPTQPRTHKSARELRRAPGQPSRG